jgi:deazaflavin-dependent oxidoreductase (nitroreductase family)
MAAMNLPRFLRRVNRVVTNPLLRPVAGRLPPLAVVHHVGRRSGRHYRTPVLAFASAKGFVIPMTYGRDVDWARNLLAASGGEIERGSRRVALRNPRIVDFGDAATRLPAALRPAFRLVDLPGYVLFDRKGEAGRRAARRKG